MYTHIIPLFTGAKPFDCPHCDKKFRTTAHRKSHITSHSKDEGIKRPRRTFRRTAKSDLSLPDIPMQEPILITDTGTTYMFDLIRNIGKLEFSSFSFQSLDYGWTEQTIIWWELTERSFWCLIVLPSFPSSSDFSKSSEVHYFWLEHHQTWYQCSSTE